MSDATQWQERPAPREDRPAPREDVLVVDAANVVGSVPDGWWRDRPGAAARLHAGLVSSLQDGRLPYGQVVLVLEGQGRKGVAAGEASGITTVHSPGSGDDTIVDRCQDLLGSGAPVTLATADRGLIDRIGPEVTLLGPRALRDRIG